MTGRFLDTRSGRIHFPAFFPVTTFGGKFPLDDVLRPHLCRLCECLMVSHFYSQKMTERPSMPVFIDSGGFASLFDGSTFTDDGNTTNLTTDDGTVIKPQEVLTHQICFADIGSTLDFIVTPGMSESDAAERQKRTIQNALWAVRQERPEGFRLYASVQAWDQDSAYEIMEAVAPEPFDGFALGGMVPRTSDPELILEIVSAIREYDSVRPLHIFGMGNPRLLSILFEHGVDSADSSSFVQQAAGKKYLVPRTAHYEALDKIEMTGDICDCPTCSRFDKNYLILEGELNNMALALHNLSATIAFAMERIR